MARRRLHGHVCRIGSGDLHPVETVWAWLRCDLAKREQCDYMAGKEITIKQSKQRAARLLQSYGEKKSGKLYSRLEKLVRGMPKRLHFKQMICVITSTTVVVASGVQVRL